MKHGILALFLFVSSFAAHAQETFVIEGQVKNVDDGTVFNLFRRDGDVGSSIGVDTLRNGRFRFQIDAIGNETERVDLLGRSDRFPSMSLSLWVRPGSHVRITGENTLIYTWDVKNDVLEQQINQRFIEDSYDLWNEYQLCNLARNKYRMTARNAASPEAQAIARAKSDSLEKISDEIYLRIDANTIRRMKETPVNSIWLDNLRKLAMGVKYNEGYPYKEDVVMLYNRLSEKEKQTTDAQNTHTLLFPPQILEIGDEMADADLYDLDGNVHHLAEFKGKHILLDFWSRGCGPCLMALPEMKEIAELYKDKLVIVSLSVDTKQGWIKASKEHEMTWQNLNELKGSNGLYAKYGVRGIPNYVLISPEGRIISKWSGYGSGLLKLKLKRLLEAESME